MISLWRIFWLEFVSLMRSWTLPALLAASLGWMFAAGMIVETDATADGTREMLVRYGLGGVFVLLVVTLLASATGAIASDRAAKRLQLTLVRPVSFFAVAWGRFLALAAAGALVLAFPCLELAFSSEFRARRCNHVYRPQMISPQAEAALMYDAYMADPETPPEVKKAKKSVVLRLLTQRAKDNYQTVGTNETAKWSFPGLGAWAAAHPGSEPSVRFRFSNTFDLRDDVRGTLLADGFSGVVSNLTQTAVTIPLRRVSAAYEPDALAFANSGANAVMLRPRQDVELLVPADAFGRNLFRAYVVMVSVLALVIAFGVFLGAGLSRPVALFTAFVMLAVSEMIPSVVDQYPDQLGTDRIDRIGLAITRTVGSCMRSVGSRTPFTALANDDCVETKDALAAAAGELLLLPLLLCLASAVCLARKHED